MYKSLNDTASTSQHVNVCFPTSKETHSYSTRFASTKNLHLPRPKTIDFKRDNVECWNELIYTFICTTRCIKKNIQTVLYVTLTLSLLCIFSLLLP